MKLDTAYRRIIHMTAELMAEAMRLGRYPLPHNAIAFDSRDRSAAFKCISYQQAIRDISALTEAAIAIRLQAFMEDKTITTVKEAARE